MRLCRLGWVLLLALLLAGCAGGDGGETHGDVEADQAEAAWTPGGTIDDSLLQPGEKHLRNIRQLTFGGENAEGYFSPDGRKLILQSKREGVECDQIFVMDLADLSTEMVSSGDGRTTCSYFIPGSDRIVYASTHAASAACPPEPDFSQGYVWKLYDSFDIYTAREDGTDLQPLVVEPGYDAEATVSLDGSKIIFTSIRSGDLELYSINPDGSDLQQLTSDLGYDGGAFYSNDGSKIVWRASRPEGEEAEAYKALLAENSIRPMNLEVFVADADGSNVVQVTDNGAANFGPFFFPDASKVIFSSNAGDPETGRNFDLWMVDVAGGEAEQVTFHESFDGFPMFSPDGKYLVFASNRNGKERGETNLFLAEWVD